MARVSTPLTKENMDSLKDGKNILGIVSGDFDGEEIKFYNSRYMKVCDFGDYEKGKDLALENAGAMGSYYVRKRKALDINWSTGLVFPRGEEIIKFVVYSNDVLTHSVYGLEFDNGIVFPDKYLGEGVKDLFDLTKERYPEGLFVRLSDEELFLAEKLVIEDLRTGKYTKRSLDEGVQLDQMFGM